MYSVVLMAAVTAGSATPENWFRNRGHGCSGCSWCACSGCAGCHGGPGYGYLSFGGNFCHGGYGGGCGGGWGFGAHPALAPGYSGCYGCYACYGPFGHGGYSYGASHWSPLGGHGCYGAYGGWSCYGSPLPWHGVIDIGPVGGTKKDPKTTEEIPLPKVKELPKTKDGASIENRARVIVQLPEDAKFYIDGNLMKAASARREFQTPDLLPGQVYFYDLKAEVVRDGRTVTETQRVVLRPGQEVTASFGSMDGAPATAARTDRE